MNRDGRSPIPHLASLRADLDRLDERVGALLAQRTRLARRVGLAKALAGIEARSLVREADVRHRYAARLAAYVPARLDALVGAILEPPASPRIAIQGGPGSWSEESLLALLPGAQVVRARTVGDAWRRCADGRADAAWLAAWNSTVGEVSATRQARGEGEIWASSTHPVAHALLARAGASLPDLRRIEGHPLALAQCAETLDRLAPQAERVPTVDGAASASRLRGASTAVVASPRIAERLPLVVLAAPVCDRADNATRFELVVPLVTRRTPAAPYDFHRKPTDAPRVSDASNSTGEIEDGR